MSDLDHLDRLRGYFHTGEIPIPTADCLDSGTISALADGTLAPDARALALKHLATCAACRRAVASVAEALADGTITREIAIVEGRARPGRLLRITIPLAAAATLLLLLWSPANDRSATHRGDGGGSVPVPIGPVGAVADARTLVWSGVIGADRYRVTLFDAQADVLYETQVSDTMADLPDSVQLVAGRPYLWKVEARTGWDRWMASELVGFTIARGPPE